MPLDEETERVIANEQEWRRTIYTDLKETKRRVTKVEGCMESMRTWQKVYRFLFAGAITSVFAYIRSKLGGSV